MSSAWPPSSAPLVAALAWMLALVLVAGWFWIVPAEGHDVGCAWTSLVALVGALPLALVRAAR